MSLHVCTRRVGDWMVDNADAIDITRQSATPGWLFLAPSADIIMLATEAKKRVDAAPRDANVILGKLWNDCATAYVAEMRASYKRQRDLWQALLERPYVILCCYCANPNRCHRMLLREHILPKLGATDGGEIVESIRH